MAIRGYRKGFIVGVFSLCGFVGGAVLGSRFGSQLLSEGSKSEYAPALSLLSALALGTVVAAMLKGVAGRLRRLFFGTTIKAADGFAGALLSIALALAVAWVAGAVMLQTPQARDLRSAVQRSAILAQVNDFLPPSGPVLNLLARFDSFPSIGGPSPSVAPPSREILGELSVKRAEASVVRVVGTACGLGVEGSGWIVAPHEVVTNAHVVAGQRDTAIQPGGAGEPLGAVVTYLDIHNDIAILLVKALDGPPLPYDNSSESGSEVAVLGYPENGPFDAAAARVGETLTVLSGNAYGRGPVERKMVLIRGRVRHGNSGGPVVDNAGRVVATVFAAREQSPPSGYGVPGSIVARDLGRAHAAVDTGPCAS